MRGLLGRLGLSRRSVASQRGLVATPRELADAERSRRSSSSKVGEHRRRPGHYGWNVRGGGRVALVEPAPEWRGTSVQVCGLWPFAAGSGLPTVGVPLGRHVSGATLCADPFSWFTAALINTPSAFVLGRPHLGKSTLVRRICTGLSDQGVWPIVLGDLKPDYTKLINALGGTVVHITRGETRFNPLDLIGPHGRIFDMDESIQRIALSDLVAAQLTVVTGLAVLVRSGGPVTAIERSILAKALTLLQTDDRGMPLERDVPQLSDLYQIVTDGPQELMAQALVSDRDEYDRETRELRAALKAMLEGGSFGSTFDGQTSEHLRLDRPGSFDISEFDGSDRVMEAAIQLTCWVYGRTTMRLAGKLADRGLGPRRRYLLVMDELWRILAAGGGTMVDLIDPITRLNRNEGFGQIMISHTMNDLVMPDDRDTKKAWGFVERSSMVFLGGLAEGEMGNLATVFALSEREKSMITDWSMEGVHDPQTGKGTVPPGRGRFLLKLGKAPGKPFVLGLTAAELEVNDTNTRWAELAVRRQQVSA